MPIVPAIDLLAHARREGYAVGYFEAWDGYSLEAVMQAAEALRSPAILGFGGAVVSQAWLDAGGLEQLAALARCLAERASVPTALMLNEMRTVGQIRRGLAAGCNLVMLASSHLSLGANIAWTRQVVEMAHAAGAAVEGELGQLADAGASPAHRAQRTDPEDAARFVEETGIDALAVSVGNVHLLMQGESPVDLDLLARLHEAVPVPLVIHGGSGFPSSAVPSAIAQGVAKFNVGTRLKAGYLEAVRVAVAELPRVADPHLTMGSHKRGDVLARGQERMGREIGELIRLYGSAGRAEDR